MSAPNDAAAWSAAVNEISLFVVLAAFAAFVIWVLTTEFMKWVRFRAGISYRLKVLERMLSAGGAAFEGDRGARLLSDLVNLDADATQRDRGRRAVQIGVISCCMAMGLLALALLNSFGARESFLALAIMAAFLGVGFLIAARATRKGWAAPPVADS